MLCWVLRTPPAPPLPSGGGGHRKPGKSTKPIWDRGGKVDEPKQPIAPAGPPPLPPLSIFGAPLAVMSAKGLPTFNEYAPADPLGMAQRLSDAMDDTDAQDAMDVLRALGLLKE